jgi:hypothetical protein
MPDRTEPTAFLFHPLGWTNVREIRRMLVASANASGGCNYLLSRVVTD